ncbi:MAG TPA: hypothetical protein VHR38_05435 [Solirubrobacterales bacterium]|nr:hypothetical protein [Solirubrobacterales bacterium]
MKLRTRKLAAFVTCLGIAAAFPVVSSADKDGVPHGDKACPAKKAKKHPKKPAPNTKGKKCGFQGEATTTAPTTTS